MKQTKEFLDRTVTRCDACDRFMIEGKTHYCQLEKHEDHGYLNEPEVYVDEVSLTDGRRKINGEVFDRPDAPYGLERNEWEPREW